MRLPTLVFAVLPHLRSLHLEQLLVEDRGLVLIVIATRRTARCPLCSHRSRRVHSRYLRTVADLPWGDHAVTLRLQVRRFFCGNRRCPRRIFAERLPEVVAPHARRTHAQQAHLLAIACALGGQAGARLAARQGAPTSRATLLRLLHRAPLPPAGIPRVLGVDDWSQRRGHTYGTILVDADQRRPIDLLPDRTASTLAAWLEAHAGIEVVTRDRSGAYGEAVARGAPSAVQVADRFHLVEDVGKAFEQVLDHHRSVLRELLLPVPIEVIQTASERASSDLSSATWSIAPHLTRLQQLQQGRRARRLERYEQLRALHERGWPVPAIARHLGMGERTLYRWLAVGSFPEWKRPRRAPSPLAPYLDYVQRRWDEGCRRATFLWRELCGLGYTGPRSTVRTAVDRLRRGLPVRTETDPPPGRSPARRPPSPRRLAGVCLRRAADRTAAEQHALARLADLCPEAGRAITLTERFTTLVRERHPGELDAWLQEATSSGLAPFQSLVAGLRRDRAAVLAAVTLPYSNGQTEGQITKLKLLKRSMYGRASFELLRRRVLLAA